MTAARKSCCTLIAPRSRLLLARGGRRLLSSLEKSNRTGQLLGVRSQLGDELTDVTAKVVIYETFVEGKLEAPNILPARYTISTSTELRRVQIQNDLEPVGRVHVGLQGTGADSRIQSDGKTRRIPRRSLLAVVLTLAGTGRTADRARRRTQ